MVGAEVGGDGMCKDNDAGQLEYREGFARKGMEGAWNYETERYFGS